MNRCLRCHLVAFAFACTFIILPSLTQAAEEKKTEISAESQVSQPSMDSPTLSPKGVTRLNDLTKIKLLARGSFGEVHLVQDVDDKIYALKIVSKSDIERLLADPIDAAKNEIALLKAARSNFVMRLYETFADDKKIYFLTEALLGGELHTLLRDPNRIGIPEADAKFYVAAMVLAFEHLHAKGIAHRDLKPENILLDERGYPRLIDFGLAKKVENGRTYSFKGTLEYLAPEIIKASGHGKEVDYWSLGALAYELIEGISPFWDRHPAAIYERILRGRVVFHLAPKDGLLRDLISNLLQVHPARRLGHRNGIADIKAHPWFAGFDWDALNRKELRAPFVPSLRSKLDTSRFPKENCGQASPYFDKLPKKQEAWGAPDDWSSAESSDEQSISIEAF